MSVRIKFINGCFSYSYTCQPFWSRRDSPDLETETRRPARRPKKADSSRFIPINAPKHDFKPAFCLFSLFFSRNSSFFCVFWPFLMYPSVVDSYPNKKICIYLGIVLVKKFILLSFSSERKKIGYIFGLLFSCSKCVELLTKTLKMRIWQSRFSKISGGACPRTPLEKRGLRPRNDRFAIIV